MQPTEHNNRPIGEQEHQNDQPSDSMQRYMHLPIVLIFVGTMFAVIGWYYGDQVSQKNTEISRLQAQVEQLGIDIRAMQTNGTGTIPLVRQDDKDRIATYINNGEYDKLEPYLERDVTVALADTDSIASRTKDRTISDLGRLNQSSGPWNFDPDDSIVADFSNGPYASLFTDDSLVGISQDQQVVSMTFNSAGKIIMICMSNDINSLKR